MPPDTKALLDTLQATARENADRGFGDALKGAKDATLNNMPSTKLPEDRLSIHRNSVELGVQEACLAEINGTSLQVRRVVGSQ
jgi:hypothetical protein